MSEAISVIVTLIVVFVIQMLKPEWFMGWLLGFLNKKLPKHANKIENALGYKLVETGIYTLKSNEDNEKIKVAIDEMEKQLKIIEEEIRLFLA
jgi:hypothetical protein